MRVPSSRQPTRDLDTRPSGYPDNAVGWPAVNLNPAVGLETGTGFAARCNQDERLKPMRAGAVGRAGGPLGSVSALRSGCDTTVAPGPTAPQFLATAPGSRQSVGRRGVACVGRRACC